MFWNNGYIQKGDLKTYPRPAKTGWIYEVIRIMDSTPLFLAEHLERLWNAAQKTNTPITLSKTVLINGIFELLQEDEIKEGNIRIQAERYDGKIQIGRILHNYPTEDNYRKGVDVSLISLQRSNPMVKIWNKEVRGASDKIIKDRNVYEVILTTPDGFLLEGSRSNIFGLKKDLLITPPQEMVLPGITRQIIINLAKEKDIPLIEQSIHKSEVQNYEAFFLSGTSPGLLPIKRIDEIGFDCNKSICNTLHQAYKEKLKDDILKTRTIWKST